MESGKREVGAAALGGPSGSTPALPQNGPPGAAAPALQIFFKNPLTFPLLEGISSYQKAR